RRVAKPRRAMADGIRRAGSESGLASSLNGLIALNPYKLRLNFNFCQKAM
ncbi:MAG: hypothetical protein ACI9I0_001123, partial [Rhodoferax sp.]